MYNLASAAQDTWSKDMGDVVTMMDYVVKPKQLTKQYKGNKYTVTYVPATKQWHWCVELVTVTLLRGDAATQVKAVREAEKQIDTVLRVQGKEVG